MVTRDQARIASNLLDTLDRRQRDVLKLRWHLQLSGAEVRAALGLTERQYRRLAEEGATALAERVEELESGQWSRRTRSLLVACLVEVTQDGKRRVGIASGRQREEAQRLLESDPHVAALYAEVRRSIRRVSALLPLPVFVATPATTPLSQLGELVADLRSHLADALGSAKHQVTALYVRAADPSLVAGAPRPGAAAVAVTGVLALGGAAYGTHEVTSASKPPPQTIPSERIPSPASTPQADVPKSPRATKRPTPPRPNRPTPAPPVAATAPSPTPAPIEARPNPKPSQPSQPTEFGFED